jgi:hypothetical protein
MGASQRRKGAVAERELAALLTDSLGVVVKRKLGAARDGGDDIQVARYRIEAKNHARLSVPEWLRQAEASCTNAGDVPIVAFRQPGGRWYVVTALEDWMPLIREEVTDA